MTKIFRYFSKNSGHTDSVFREIGVNIILVEISLIWVIWNYKIILEAKICTCYMVKCHLIILETDFSL